MIDEIAVALNQGLYLVALSAALTLPDVCGKAEYPEEAVQLIVSEMEAVKA